MGCGLWGEVRPQRRYGDVSEKQERQGEQNDENHRAALIRYPRAKAVSGDIIPKSASVRPSMRSRAWSASLASTRQWGQSHPDAKNLTELCRALGEGTEKMQYIQEIIACPRKRVNMPDHTAILLFWNLQPTYDRTALGFRHGSTSRAAYVEWFLTSAPDKIRTERGKILITLRDKRAYALAQLRKRLAEARSAVV